MELGMAKPKTNFVIVHPKKAGPDNTQVDDLQFGIITLNKKVSDIKEHLQAVTSIPGIDQFQVAGIYTFQLVIASTFDFEEVWTEIRTLLEVATSAIVIAGNFKK
jgi:hypothetical protein